MVSKYPKAVRRLNVFFSLMSDSSTTVSVTLANISIALGAGNTEMAHAERDPIWGRR